MGFVKLKIDTPLSLHEMLISKVNSYSRFEGFAFLDGMHEILMLSHSMCIYITCRNHLARIYSN